jgi:hypothetical protein
MTGEELQRLRDWADAKVTANQEPLWTWYQFMKLREALDAIVGGMEWGGALTREGSVQRPKDATARLTRMLSLP